MIKLSDKLKEFIEWRNTPVEDREVHNYTKLAAQLGVSTKTLTTWDKRLVDEELNAPSEVEQFLSHLYDQAMKPNANAKTMELYAKIKGILTDKSEVRISLELSADQLIRQHFESQKWLREAGYLPSGRVVEVQPERDLLSE